ncbi:WG repeat-containing protein, partial [Marinigracilibium pacificum]
KKKGDKIGFVDKDMNTVIPFEYDFATAFYFGHSIVTKGNKKHIINEKNIAVLDVSKYDFINITSNKHATVAIKKSNKEGESQYGAINYLSGELIYPLGDYHLLGFENGLCPIDFGYDENHMPVSALLNLEKQLIIPKGKYNSILKLGQLIIATDYINNFEDVYDKNLDFLFKTSNSIDVFNNTSKNDIYRLNVMDTTPRLYGAIDHKGNIIIPPIYHNINDFGWNNDGLINVQLNDESFFIDLNGREYKK